MPLTTQLRRALARGRSEAGFSMVVTLGVITMLLLSAAVSVTTVAQDQPVARVDRQQKTALAAAEAGLQVYVHKLLTNNSYWDQCAVPADGVNLNIGQNGPDTRSWVSLPDKTAAYTIEALPANGAAKCLTTAPEDTMIDKATQTFRIRVTGQALSRADTAKRSGPRRSIIATFKRKSFLDYIYFTDFEVTDPTTYASYPALNWPTLENTGRNPNKPYDRRDVVRWGNDACGEYAYAKGENNTYRESQSFAGTGSLGAGRKVNGTWQTWSTQCSEIRFVDGDSVQGPMHTNDSLLLCGSPDFGRQPGDSIETSAPGTGTVASSYRQDPDCGTSAPDVNYENKPVTNASRGTWRYNQPLLNLPASNKSLADEASAQYTFQGETTFVLSTTGITVTGMRKDGTVLNGQRIDYPSDGVIYVDNRSDLSFGPACTGSYQVSAPYSPTRPGCGIANVSGTYPNGLTIGAADDIVIKDDLVRSGSSPALLGLIANNFIRVFHPVTDQNTCNSNPTNAVNRSDAPTNLRVDAALLTLTHSFIVDNYRCGSSLGTLTVFGAISQKFRGPVGTGSRGSSTTGYLKKYLYDDRLAVRSPPKFLDPVQSAWRVKTFQEQVPATPQPGVQ